MEHKRRMNILRFVICVIMILAIMAYIAPNAR